MESKRKVLHLIDSLGLGGAQMIVRGIFEAQPKNESIFLLSLRKREINFEINHKNVFCFDSKSRFSLMPLYEAKKLIETNEIDILHCHLFRSQVFGLFMKLLWFKKLKLVYHEHGEVFQKHLLYNFFILLARFFVNGYIAVSQVTKEKIMQVARVSAVQIKVIYNFIRSNGSTIMQGATSIIDKEKLTRPGLKEFVIGFAGRLSSEKGCKYLLDVLPSLSFNYRVLIAGDGPLRESLSDIVRGLRLENRVTFLGYVEDMTSFFAAIDLLVVPSIFESFGLSAIEAQSASVPVLSSDVGGLIEILNDGSDCLLYKNEVKNDLQEKITLLMRNSDLRAKLVANGLINSRKFGVDTYINNLEQFYANL